MDGTQRMNKTPSEKDLFEWQASERPFKPRNKEFWVSVVAIAAIAGLILFIIDGIISVMLVVSVVFLFYVLSTVKPHSMTYRITDKALYLADQKLEMERFTGFWFGKRMDHDLLILSMNTFPGRLELVINGSDIQKIRKALSEILVEEKPNPTNLDNAADWLSQKIPGNK